MADRHPRFTWEKHFRATARLGPAATAVGLMISTYADRNGFARPSRARLADQIGVTEKTIQRAVRTLIEAGWLSPVDRPRGRDYRLRHPPRQGTPMSPIHDEQGTPVSETGDIYVPLSDQYQTNRDANPASPNGAAHHGEDPDQHYLVDIAMEDLEQANQWPSSVVDDHVTTHHGRPWDELTLEEKRQSLEHLASVVQDL